MSVSVSLCGIQYSVFQHEGLILFIENNCPREFANRFSFSREDGCWFLKIHSDFPVMAAHLLMATKWVEDTHGRDQYKTIGPQQYEGSD